jgi:hypothetical protein
MTGLPVVGILAAVSASFAIGDDPLLVIGAWIYVLYRYAYHVVRFG